MGRNSKLQDMLREGKTKMEMEMEIPETFLCLATQTKNGQNKTSTADCRLWTMD